MVTAGLIRTPEILPTIMMMMNSEKPSTNARNAILCGDGAAWAEPAMIRSEADAPPWKSTSRKVPNSSARNRCAWVIDGSAVVGWAEGGCCPDAFRSGCEDDDDDDDDDVALWLRFLDGAFRVLIPDALCLSETSFSRPARL